MTKIIKNRKINITKTNKYNKSNRILYTKWNRNRRSDRHRYRANVSVCVCVLYNNKCVIFDQMKSKSVGGKKLFHILFCNSLCHTCKQTQTTNTTPRSQKKHIKYANLTDWRNLILFMRHRYQRELQHRLRWCWGWAAATVTNTHIDTPSICYMLES